MKLTLLISSLIGLAMTASVHAADDSAFKEAQTPGEWRMATYIGSPIFNASGDKIGDVKDVLFDRSGKIRTVVIGVGGFLGLGEKRVAVPFEVVTYVDENDERRVVVPLSKEALQSAPAYKVSEKTTLEKVGETATEVAEKASERASELKDQAVKTIQEYRQGADAEGEAN